MIFSQEGDRRSQQTTVKIWWAAAEFRRELGVRHRRIINSHHVNENKFKQYTLLTILNSVIINKIQREKEI
jgi:hypothetical protein